MMFQKSNIGSFKVRNNALLLLRTGSANGQVQKHKGKPVDLNGNKIEDPDELESWRKSIRRPPVRRGFFAFPYPFSDEFYFYHIYRRNLPKIFEQEGKAISQLYDEYDNMTPEDLRALEELNTEHYEKVEAKLDEIKRRLKPKKIWYKGTFYSHISPRGLIDDGRSWWEYDNTREWIESARKFIRCRMTKDIWINYERGHLELFIPN